MPLLYPVAAAVLQAASQTIDKVTLNVKRVTYKVYNVISFPLIFFFTLIAFLIFRPALSMSQFTTLNTILITAAIVLGVITNAIYYKALKNDKLSEMQAIGLLSKIPLIIFAGIFFIEERNYITMILASIAALSLIWSHWERHHFHVAKRTWPFLIWVLIVSPFGGIIAKELLKTFNPISLHLVTSFFQAIIFFSIYRKNLKSVPKKAIALLLLTNLLTSAAWILQYFSYQISGIVFTVLILSLQPLLIYFTSIFYLKEKPNKKKIISFIIILLAIITSQII